MALTKQLLVVSLTTENALIANNDARKRKLSTESFRKVRMRLKAALDRRMSVLRRPKITSQASNAGISQPIVTSSNARCSDDTLVAHLDAISLSQSELELLRRMEQVCHTARVARERRQTYHNSPIHPIAAGQCLAAKLYHPITPAFDLHLRGGGDEPTPFPFAGRRRRTTLPCPEPPVPLDDTARPNAVLWWLAGGRMSHKGKIPTIGELRVRKEVEQANRSMVGFWGTVLGIRRVGTVGILPQGDGGADLEGTSVKSSGSGGGAVGNVVDAADVVRSAPGSVKAPSDGRGSSSQSSKSSKSSKSSRSSKSSKPGSSSIDQGNVKDQIDDVVGGEAANGERATSLRSGGKASSVPEHAQEAHGANEIDGDADAEANPVRGGTKKAEHDENDETAR